MVRLVTHAVLIAACTMSATASGGDTQLNGTSLNAAEPTLREKQLNGKALQEMFGGIVTNQTITVAGQTFYQCFVSAWQDKPDQERFVIAIHERPSARWGNEVWVDYAQRRVFQAVLPANRSNIKALADRAVEIAYNNVVDAEVHRLLFKDPDLGPDEF